MRTMLNIDDDALCQAMKAASGKTKPEIVNEALRNEALREFARRRRVRGLLAYRGKVEWTGSVDDLRKRRSSRR